MFDIELQVIHSGYDRKTCWVHARPGAIPGDPASVVVTMHKLRLTGSDVFYPINDMRTDDCGQSWVGPVPHEEAFARRPCNEYGFQEGVCDFTPSWYEKSGVLLGTGHTVRYENDNIPSGTKPRDTIYSTYDRIARTWSPWKRLDVPDPIKFYNQGAGSTQRVDLPNGDILLPTYYVIFGTEEGAFDGQLVSTVMRCAFDGTDLTYMEHGTELTIPGGRGFAEPSLAYAGGHYFLTLRNNESGYVAAGVDGLHFDRPRRWNFDDGVDLGNYNTQQHWLAHGEDLYLIYTRWGAGNDHVFRHRAPLFIAQVDKNRLCVIRETERVLVPEHGARLGNFGVTKVDDHEYWVAVSEWMQTNPPDHFDSTVCEQYGSDNRIFIAKVRFT